MRRPLGPAGARRRHRGRLAFLGLLAAGVALATAPAGAGEDRPDGAGAGTVRCVSDPGARPAVPVALVALDGSGAEALDALVATAGSGLAVTGRLLVSDRNDAAAGAPTGWSVVPIADVAEALGDLNPPDPGLVVLSAAGSGSGRGALDLGALDRAVVVDVEQEGAEGPALVTAATEAQAELVEAGPGAPLGDATLTAVARGGGWVLDVADRPAGRDVQVTSLRIDEPRRDGPGPNSSVPTTSGPLSSPSTRGTPSSPPTTPPTPVACTAEAGSRAGVASLPVRLEGEGLDGSMLEVDLVDPATGRRATLTGTLAAPATSDDGDDSDDDGEQAAGTRPRSGSGSGSSPLVPALLVAVALGAGVLAVVLLSRRRALAPAFAGPQPGRGWTDAAPTVERPPPDVARPPLPPPPPPTPADGSWLSAQGVHPPIALPGGGTPRRPQEAGGHLTWVLDTGIGLHVGAWSEKVVGRGEDAEPLLHAHRSGASIVSVFDGLGGAGGTIARVEADGTERTGAWVASHLAREVVHDWFTARAADPADLRPDDLARHLAFWFQQEAERFGGSAPAVRGSLHRVLPTTMAAVAVRPRAHGAVADVLWAGDSRCFLLRPDTGLQVLTVDDTRQTDALALIRDDYPMHNLVSADREFQVNHRRLTLALPAVFLVATDGCFRDVLTPAHFELHVLDTLVAATGPDEWMARLVDRLADGAGDDASLAVSGPGLTGFDRMRDAVGARLAQVREQHWDPFSAASSPEEVEALRESSWQAYRPGYEAIIRGGGR